MNFHVLVWTLTVFLGCFKDVSAEIKATGTTDGVDLSCDGDVNVTSSAGHNEKKLSLLYKDSNSREYYCTEDSTILVKFRTCDNCIEMDTASIVGVAVGNLVATVAVCVAVYLIASKTGPSVTLNTNVKKRSDKHPLVPGDGHYQPLRQRQQGQDVYDQLRT